VSLGHVIAVRLNQVDVQHVEGYLALTTATIARSLKFNYNDKISMVYISILQLENNQCSGVAVVLFTKRCSDVVCVET
jgi:hypothetical protein